MRGREGWEGAVQWKYSWVLACRCWWGWKQAISNVKGLICGYIYTCCPERLYIRQALVDGAFLHRGEQAEPSEVEHWKLLCLG